MLCTNIGATQLFVLRILLSVRTYARRRALASTHAQSSRPCPEPSARGQAREEVQSVPFTGTPGRTRVRPWCEVRDGSGPRFPHGDALSGYARTIPSTRAAAVVWPAVEEITPGTALQRCAEVQPLWTHALLWDSAGTRLTWHRCSLEVRVNRRASRCLEGKVLAYLQTSETRETKPDDL